MDTTGNIYRGRFAPSPTGPLHFGSLVAAVGSYLYARTAGGIWLLRIEDIDPPREVPGAATTILKTLEAYSFAWDGPVIWQSDRRDAYEAALERLTDRGLTYVCSCSRRRVAADATSKGPEGPVYPGTCRDLGLSGPNHAIRLRTHDETVVFEDDLQGSCRQNPNQDTGDFVIRRRDGYFAYQLACVVDDADEGVTDIVRGCDLLDSTGRQMVLQRLLGLSPVAYAHVPIAVDAIGQKLSKQTWAAPVPPTGSTRVLWRALDFLKQSPPAELANDGLDDLWTWAIGNWNPAALKRLRKIPVEIA